MEEKAIALFTRFTNVSVLYRTSDGEYFIELDDAQKHLLTLAGGGAFTTVNRIDPLPPVEEPDPNTPVWILLNEPLSLNKSLGFDGCISFTTYALSHIGDELHTVNRAGSFTTGNFVLFKARNAGTFRAKYGQITAVDHNILTVHVTKIYGTDPTPITSWEFNLTGEMITTYEIAVKNGYTGTEADWVNDAITAAATSEAAKTISTNKAAEAASSAGSALGSANTAIAARDTAITKATEATTARDTAITKATEATTARDTTVTKTTEATTAAAAAVAAKNTAESFLAGLTGVNGDLGAYNATTNTPALTATPAGGITVGRYYTVTVAGTVGFAGNNFASGATLHVGDKLLKLNTQWYLESNRPVGSVAAGDGRAVSGDEVNDALKNKLGYKEVEEDGLYIADSDGNYVARLDDFDTVNVSNNFVEKIGEKLNLEESGNLNLKEVEEAGTYVTDIFGNIVQRLDDFNVPKISPEFIEKIGVSGVMVEENIQVLIPDVLPVVVGYTNELYNELLIDCHSVNDYQFIYTSNVGSSNGRKYTITANSSNVGNHNLNVKILNKYKKIVFEKNVIVRVFSSISVPLTLDSQLRMVSVGDSWLSGGKQTRQVVDNFNSLYGLKVFKSIGSRNDGNLNADGYNYNEGRSGWRSDQYIAQGWASQRLFTVSGITTPPLRKKKYRLAQFTEYVYGMEVEELNLTLSGSTYSGTILCNFFGSGANFAINNTGTLTAYNGSDYGESTSSYAGDATIAYTSQIVPEGAGNPFWNVDKMDFNNYATTFDLEPNFFYIGLGTNASNDHENIPSFINSLRATSNTPEIDWVNMPIIISLQQFWGDLPYNLERKRWVHEKHRLLKNAIDNMGDENVFLMPFAQSFDSRYNFGRVNAPVSPRNTAYTEIQIPDIVHCTTEAYNRCGDLIFFQVLNTLYEINNR